MPGKRPRYLVRRAVINHSGRNKPVVRRDEQHLAWADVAEFSQTPVYDRLVAEHSSCTTCPWWT
jgi:L-amino acid N-acyltransferase YncA